MDRQYEDRLADKGVIKYSDLFTERNFWTNVIVYNELINMKDKINKNDLDILYFLFSSSLRYTNNMTRVTANWEGGNPTSMDKHAYWLPSQFVENNVFNILQKRLKALNEGFNYSKDNIKDSYKEQSSFDSLKRNGGYYLLNQSSTKLPIDDNSIDVIITDPPYGSNVQYAELSIIWNVWFEHYNNLDGFLFTDEEAIMNRRLPKNKGAKDSKHYEDTLYGVFKECHRILKNDSYMVFTFNNKNINVWIAMLRAVAKAGFYLPDNGVIFQDYIESYKNTSHLRYSGNIHGDFIYSFVKGWIGYT